MQHMRRGIGDTDHLRGPSGGRRGGRAPSSSRRPGRSRRGEGRERIRFGKPIDHALQRIGCEPANSFTYCLLCLFSASSAEKPKMCMKAADGGEERETAVHCCGGEATTKSKY